MCTAQGMTFFAGSLKSRVCNPSDWELGDSILCLVDLFCKSSIETTGTDVLFSCCALHPIIPSSKLKSPMINNFVGISLKFLTNDYQKTFKTDEENHPWSRLSSSKGHRIYDLMKNHNCR